MEGVSSDGDPKLLSAMLHEIVNGGLDPVQDTVHIGSKLRNRLLALNAALKMGSFEVSISHLKNLVKHVQKSVHGLSQMDVSPIDRMNYTSVEKIIENRVIEALKKNVEKSDGTIKYLEIIRDVTSSFLNHDLTPLQRVFRIWHAVFFLRTWRQFVLKTAGLTLKHNFITSNAYHCVEINASTLISLIKKFRDENKPEKCLTPLFDSQTCERTFRIFRSMGTTNYTKINFSLYELINMIGRLEVANAIAYFKFDNEDIVFPNKRRGKTMIFELPSDKEIIRTINQAKAEAMEEAKNFGMQWYRYI